MTQQGIESSSTRALIDGALAQFGFANMKAYFDTAYADTFSQVKWTQFYSEASPSLDGEIRQIIGSKSLPIMARYVAFDGDAPKLSNDSFSVTTQDMPRMKLGFDSNEKSMLQWRKIVQQYGGTPPADLIFKAFSRDATDIMAGVHAQISYTGLQVLSTGQYLSTEDNNHGGIIGKLYDFGVPAGNKVKTGFGSHGAKYAWSSASAKPIGDLQDMIIKANLEFKKIAGFAMNQTTWDTFVNHPNVMSMVSLFITNGVSSNAFVGVDDVNRFISTKLGFPPITVINDAFSLPHYDASTNKLVNSSIHGFADHMVVGMPAGTFGELQWSQPVLEFGDFTTEGGKFLVTEITDKKKKSTETWIEFTGFPVPTRIDSTYYLNTNEATA